MRQPAGRAPARLECPDGITDPYLRASAFPRRFASGLPASGAAVLGAAQRPLTATAVEAAVTVR